MPGCPPIGGPGGEGMPPQGMPGGEGMPPQGGPSPEGPPLELPPMGGGERQPFLSGAHKSSDIGWSSLLAAVTALIAMLILG